MASGSEILLLVNYYLLPKMCRSYLVTLLAFGLTIYGRISLEAPIAQLAAQGIESMFVVETKQRDHIPRVLTELCLRCVLSNGEVNALSSRREDGATVNIYFCLLIVYL
jgi:hypothetical protein